MRPLLTSIIVLTSVGSLAQDKCEAIIDWRYLHPIEVYSTPGGKVVGQFQNDSIAEDFIQLQILDVKKNFLQVELAMTITNKKQTGWIEKGEYIGAYLRQERPPTMDLTLFQSPSPAKPFIIKKWTPGLLTITACNGGWVSVSAVNKGKTITGWISAVELCANPYSTCN